MYIMYNYMYRLFYLPCIVSFNSPNPPTHPQAISWRFVPIAMVIPSRHSVLSGCNHRVSGWKFPTQPIHWCYNLSIRMMIIIRIISWVFMVIFKGISIYIPMKSVMLHGSPSNPIIPPIKKPILSSLSPRNDIIHSYYSPSKYIFVSSLFHLWPKNTKNLPPMSFKIAIEAMAHWSSLIYLKMVMFQLANCNA